MENANVHKISRVSHKCCGWEDKNYDSLFYYCVKAKREVEYKYKRWMYIQYKKPYNDCKENAHLDTLTIEHEINVKASAYAISNNNLFC